MKLLLVVCACAALTGLVCGKQTHDFSVDITLASVCMRKIVRTEQN